MQHLIDPETKIEIRYQFLPHGTNRQNAKRVNVRTDFFGIEGM